MGPYNAILGVMAFVIVVFAIGMVDVLLARRRARSSGQLPLDLRESRPHPPAHAAE